MDTQLKSGNKEWSDEQLDRQLDRVMVLFRYIHGNMGMIWWRPLCPYGLDNKVYIVHICTHRQRCVWSILQEGSGKEAAAVKECILWCREVHATQTKTRWARKPVVCVADWRPCWQHLLFLLVAECGANFTSKLEGMFKDMELSREMMISFKEVHIHADFANIRVIFSLHPPFR